MLKNDIRMYDAVGVRLQGMVESELGLLAPQYNKIYTNSNLISYGYIFLNNKEIALYIKDSDGKITVELKKWVDKKNISTEKAEDIDMSKIKDIIVELYRKITEESNVEELVDDLFNSKPTEQFGKQFGEQSNEYKPFI